MDYINDICQTIIGNTLYTIIAVALLILIGYGVVKKLFKLALIVGICLMLYLGFIYYQGGEDGLKETQDSLIDKAEDVKEKVKEKVKDETDKIKDKALKTVEEEF